MGGEDEELDQEDKVSSQRKYFCIDRSQQSSEHEEEQKQKVPKQEV